jgi:hypothetical protein
MIDEGKLLRYKVLHIKSKPLRDLHRVLRDLPSFQHQFPNERNMHDGCTSSNPFLFCILLCCLIPAIAQDRKNKMKIKAIGLGKTQISMNMPSDPLRQPSYLAFRPLDIGLALEVYRRDSIKVGD